MRIASSSTIISFHEWPGGDLINTYTPSGNLEGPIRSISWSKDGAWIVMVPIGGNPEVITIKDDIKQLISIKEMQATCAAFQHTTKRSVVLGTSAKEVLIYDIKSKTIKKRYEPCKAVINQVECTSKDTHVAAACENGDILLYSNTVMKLSNTFRMPKSSSCTKIRCDPLKRNLIVGGSSEGVVALFDSNVSKATYVNPGHVAQVTGLAFSPARNAVVVSTALDRRLIFHDVVNGNCIAQVPLDNSGTAVDFAADGISLAVACQNGNIYMYDTRAVNQPVGAFKAHCSRIHHVLFKKSEDATPAQFEQVSEEISNRNELHSPAEQPAIKSPTTSFSFYPDTFNTGSLQKPPEELQVQEAGDSFMAAMEMNFTNSSSLCPIVESKSSSSTVASIHLQSEEKKPVERSLLNVKHMSSTPKYFTNDPSLNFSPVLCGNQSIPSSVTVQPTTSLPTDKIREIIRQEIKSELAELKKELKYEQCEMMSNMQRNFLELHMSIVKEFVQVENNLNKLKQELLVEDPCYSEDMLMQENYRLKRELTFLKEKLSKNE